MSNPEKGCNNCRFSYYKQDTSKHPTIGLLRQHCGNETYNSEKYTEEMYLEDCKNGCCRFWAPIE